MLGILMLNNVCLCENVVIGRAKKDDFINVFLLSLLYTIALPYSLPCQYLISYCVFIRIKYFGEAKRFL